ncbi:MAG: protein required for attachment to host cells [Chlamydiales bacterium]|jgi:protein required for attachment to host cells
MKKTWVVIANGSEGRIYQAKSKIDFLLVHTFSHKESRQLGTELKSDGPGMGKGSFGAGRHAMEETTSPKEVEMQRFAMEIADYLDDGRKHNRVERIYLSASPHFLGLLQKNLSSHLVKMVTETIEKDFTNVLEADLSKHINITTLG